MNSLTLYTKKLITKKSGKKIFRTISSREFTSFDEVLETLSNPPDDGFFQISIGGDELSDEVLTKLNKLLKPYRLLLKEYSNDNGKKFYSSVKYRPMIDLSTI